MHEMGPHHPESPDRLDAISDRLIASGLDPHLVHHDAPAVTRKQLERVHEPDYIAAIEAASPEQGVRYLDPDTAMNPSTWDAALRAAGAAVLATDLVAGGTAESAFCSVRPPGHHATRTRAMGFCIFNNVAVGAMHALEAHRLERVAIVDFDVHHGNGTEQIFSGDKRVLMAGSFQHPFYPYSGTDHPAANMFNVPLPAGTGSQGFREAVERFWIPALDRFRPEMVFVSAGFDAHREDPLAGLKLVENDYTWVTREMIGAAARYAQNRIVSSLEGGYSLSALGRSAAEHVKALIEA